MKESQRNVNTAANVAMAFMVAFIIVEKIMGESKGLSVVIVMLALIAAILFTVSLGMLVARHNEEKRNEEDEYSDLDSGLHL